MAIAVTLAISEARRSGATPLGHRPMVNPRMPISRPRRAEACRGMFSWGYCSVGDQRSSGGGQQGYQVAGDCAANGGRRRWCESADPSLGLSVETTGMLG